MRRILLSISLAAAMAVLFTMPAVAQDNTQPAAEGQPAAASQPPAAPQAPAAPTPAPEPVQPKELSTYGEVQAVNAQANSLSVQYYDYDKDEEKTMEIVLGPETKLENAASLNDIKKGSWVDVTYTVVDAKFLAKFITVEKEEELPPDTDMASTNAATDASEEE